MHTIVIDIPPETFRRLEEQSRRAGKAPEEFTRDLVEAALETYEADRPRTTREVLQASGQIRPLSEKLRQKIIPGVTLAEVRTTLAQSGGPSLSEIILNQRVPKE